MSEQEQIERLTNTSKEVGAMAYFASMMNKLDVKHFDIAHNELNHYLETLKQKANERNGNNPKSV